jgi:hypothetical protein
MGDDEISMLEDQGSDSGSGTSSALSTLSELTNPPSSAEGRQYATEILKNVMSDKDASGEQSLMKDYSTDADQAKAALQSARQKLMAINISPQERAYAVAQAFLSPTRTGNFGDSLANWAGAEEKMAQQQRQLQMEKFGTGLGLDQRQEAINQGLLGAKLKLQALHEAQQGALAKGALGVLARPPLADMASWQLKTIPLSGNRKQNILFNPKTGQEVPQGQPFSDLGSADPTMAQQIADYKLPPIQGYALTRPGSTGPATMDLVSQLNPNYDATLYPQIVRTRNDFSAGKDATKMGSMERAILHMRTLGEALDAMQNGNIKVLNRIANELGVQVGNNPAPAVFHAIQGIVASELSTAVQASSGVSERQANEQRISSDFSKPITKAVLNYYTKLLSAQFDTLKDQYEAGMGLANFDEGTPEYEKHKAMADREFYEHIQQPYVRSLLTPAPPQAIADLSNQELLKKHPDLPLQFKAAYGYLPSEIH